MDLGNLETHRVDLAKPLLLIKAPAGILACGYLNVETFNKTGEAAAIVTGVADYEQMLAASVVAVSEAAGQAGVVAGESGASALSKMGAG